MFNVGDKVVYPLYGAGVVEAVEDRVVDGVSANYYVLNVPVGNLKLTVSAARSEAMGLRYIHTKAEVADIISRAEPIEMSSNWTQRNKDNMNILKSGDLYKIVEVFKTLILRAHEGNANISFIYFFKTAEPYALTVFEPTPKIIRRFL